MRARRWTPCRKRSVANRTSASGRLGRCRTNGGSTRRGSPRPHSASGRRERRLRNSASAPLRERHSRSPYACGQPHMPPSARGRNTPFGKSAHRALRIERNRVSASGRLVRAAPCQTKGFSPAVSTNGPLVHRGLIRVCVMQEALRRIPHKQSAGTWENGRRLAVFCLALDPLNSPDSYLGKTGSGDRALKGQAA